MKLDGASALVTGGASGLGRATVETLHGAGARVVIMDLPSSAGKAVAEELGDGVEFAAADVRDPEQVAAAVELAAGTAHPLRVVVNCAGLGTPAPFLTRRGPMDLEFFRDMVDINLTGTFNVARLASARMAANEPTEGDERGVIVNTASIAALDGPAAMTAYAAAKAGVVGMTLSLARDLAPHRIRVMTIAPGFFETPMFHALPAVGQDVVPALHQHPVRLGDAGEFAALVRHIVENPMLNGETIRLDGAVRMPAL